MINKKSQVSIEYIIIMGFVTIVIIGLLGIAFVYSGSIKDRLKMTQINNFGNKIISTAESVFYYGEPSKATISVYLPENVEQIEISENTLFITYQGSSGIDKIAFSSEVPIEGTLNSISGVKKIEIIAEESRATISQV
ncbi:MAG: hypothetical protein WC438_04790 [Candidatus Pacearchaeota archaeon]